MILLKLEIQKITEFSHFQCSSFLGIHTIKKRQLDDLFKRQQSKLTNISAKEKKSLFSFFFNARDFTNLDTNSIKILEKSTKLLQHLFIKPEETHLVPYQVLSENWDLHIDPYSTPPCTSRLILSILILFFSNLIPRKDFKSNTLVEWRV